MPTWMPKSGLPLEYQTNGGDRAAVVEEVDMRVDVLDGWGLQLVAEEGV